MCIFLSVLIVYLGVVVVILPDFTVFKILSALFHCSGFTNPPQNHEVFSSIYFSRATMKSAGFLLKVSHKLFFFASGIVVIAPNIS